MKCVQRHAITEFVKGDGQRGGRRALLLVHGVAEGARLGDRAGDIEQYEHRQITAAAQAVEVDGLVGCRPGQHFDARLDRGVDVDVVALRLPMAAIQADPEPGQRPPQARGRRGRANGVSLLCGADRSRARCTSRAGSG